MNVGELRNRFQVLSRLLLESNTKGFERTEESRLLQFLTELESIRYSIEVEGDLQNCKISPSETQKQMTGEEYWRNNWEKSVVALTLDTFAPDIWKEYLEFDWLYRYFGRMNTRDRANNARLVGIEYP